MIECTITKSTFNLVIPCLLYWTNTVNEMTNPTFYRIFDFYSERTWASFSEWFHLTISNADMPLYFPREQVHALPLYFLVNRFTHHNNHYSKTARDINHEEEIIHYLKNNLKYTFSAFHHHILASQADIQLKLRVISYPKQKHCYSNSKKNKRTPRRKTTVENWKKHHNQYQSVIFSNTVN